MIEVAMHSPYKGILQKEISQKHLISVKYLDQITSSLKTAGLITNVAGKKSGYRLTRQAETITAYDIYRAFESDPDTLPLTEQSVADILSNDLQQQIVKTLKNKTLKDLVDLQKEINANITADMYYI
jgi:Rrf2 family protein